MRDLNKIWCKKCRWFMEDSMIIDGQYCTSKKTAQFHPIEGWIDDEDEKDPMVLNQNGDCPFFERI